MVASTHPDALVKVKACSPSEEAFAQAVAAGRLPTQAYRMAWGGKQPNADVLACRVMQRPHVQARIAEVRAQMTARIQADAIMSQRERRELLAQTARSVAKSQRASHGERIRALELDARLAGELTEQVQVSGEIDVRACVLALMGSAAAIPVAQAVSDEAPATETHPEHSDSQDSNGTASDHKLPAPVQALTVAPTGLVEPPIPGVEPEPVRAVSFVEED